MLELVLLLAHTCVAEIDLQDAPDECVVMWGIDERLAAQRGVELGQQVREHAAYWRNPRAQRARPWIPQLDVHARAAPADWPARRSWDREREKWIAYVEAAEQFATEHVRGTPRAPVCARADDYGGTPDDGVHADDAAPCTRAQRVTCMAGERQAYWNTGPCRVARRGRAISAKLAAGRAR